MENNSPASNNDKIINACAEAAEKLHMSIDMFMREVYDRKQKTYDKEDIISWLDEEGYAYDNNDIDIICEEYRDHYDANLGTWDNISNAYDRCVNRLATED